MDAVAEVRETRDEGRKTRDEGRETKCKVRAKGANTEVGESIEKALTMFDEMIGKSEILEIDALLEKGDLISGKDHTCEEAGFKIVNHNLENAYFVPLDTVIKSSPAEIKSLVIAMADGVFQRLEGCTRIVGYYSRVHNWNKSKIGELKDRQMGNYKVGTRSTVSIPDDKNPKL